MVDEERNEEPTAAAQDGLPESPAPTAAEAPEPPPSPEPDGGADA